MSRSSVLPEHVWNEVMALFRRNEFRDVTVRGGELMKEYANDDRIYNLVGLAHAELRNYQLAIATFEQLLTRQPNCVPILNNLGKTLISTGRPKQAIALLKKAQKLRPDSGEISNNLGNAWKALGKKSESLKHYQRAIRLNPKIAEAHKNIGVWYREAGDYEAAKKAYRRALEIKPNYPAAQFALDALTGKNVPSPPRAVVEGLFDEYAPNFEKSLLLKLDYAAPDAIRELVESHEKNESRVNAVDLGCGTGLLGASVKHIFAELEGVDVSAEMLKVAVEKNAYKQLWHADIIQYLRNGSLSFDYFFAADVFIYVGDLSEVFELVKTRNDRTGRFVFSIETSQEDGYQLGRSGRYAHSPSYIEKLCDTFDYKILRRADLTLRKERESNVMGSIYMLEFQVRN